jgi:prevent-host-death family protein
VAVRREIPASEFKARCLALLDEVAETKEILVITKRGKPVAELGPAEPPPSLEGTIEYRISDDELVHFSVWDDER